MRGWLQSLVALFSLAPQRAFGYAGLVLVLGFAAILGLTQWRNDGPNVTHSEVATGVAITKEKPGNIVAPAVTPVEGLNPTPIDPTLVNPTPINPTPGNQTPAKSAPNRRNLNVRPQAANLNNQMAVKGADKNADTVKLLPGERSYLQTIAELDSTIKSVVIDRWSCASGRV